MNGYAATSVDKQAFDQAGYVLVRELFDSEEIDLVNRYARADRQIAAAATSRVDAQGGTTTLALNNHLGDSLYSTIVRLRRVVQNMSVFLDDEVYHYHHKMMLKEPIVGGAWEWHQDYGYWYDFGCLYPTMASCFIAVDPATKANGCLQVIPGSHHLGRMNHMKVGGQTGADPERVAAVIERLPVEHVEMNPGDALFFHGNLLHRSDQNRSPDPRWSLICCYNTRTNDPFKKSRHPNYSPLETIADKQFLQRARDQTKKRGE